MDEIISEIEEMVYKVKRLKSRGLQSFLCIIWENQEKLLEKLWRDDHDRYHLYESQS